MCFAYPLSDRSVVFPRFEVRMKRLPSGRGIRSQSASRLEGISTIHSGTHSVALKSLLRFQSLRASGFGPLLPVSLFGMDTGSMEPPSSMNRSCSLRFLGLIQWRYEYANWRSRRCRSRSSCSFLRLLCRIEKCFDLILCICEDGMQWDETIRHSDAVHSEILTNTPRRHLLL